MQKLSVPTSEQKQLLSKRGKLPPSEWRKHLSKEGLELWDSLNSDYENLHNELEAYFQGLPSQLSDLSGDKRELLEARKDWFLGFYELLRQAWDFLTPYHFDRYGNEVTPGLLASEILKQECYGSMQPAIAGRVEIAPRRNYDSFAKMLKAERRGDKAIKQFEKDYFRQLGAYKKNQELEVAVISYCRYAATQDKYVKKALKKFDDSRETLRAKGNRIFNVPKKKQEIWEKGFRKPQKVLNIS